MFGVPDDRLGEQLHAVVEVRSPVTTDELREHCRAHLADYKVPATVELIDELPRQPNGKVLKRVLRDQHWAGRDVRIGRQETPQSPKAMSRSARRSWCHSLVPSQCSEPVARRMNR